jgi:hypothetical protein
MWPALNCDLQRKEEHDAHHPDRPGVQLALRASGIRSTGRRGGGPGVLLTPAVADAGQKPKNDRKVDQALREKFDAGNTEAVGVSVRLKPGRENRVWEKLVARRRASAASIRTSVHCRSR